MSLARPGGHPAFFEYFLDHRNHEPGVPLDFISYHFYASPSPDETPEIQQHTAFAQADGFLKVVRYIEAIRKRLSPETRTMINARYWALKLLKDNFGPGDKLVETRIDNRYVYALGAVKSDGERRVLLVNKRDRPFEIAIAGASGAVPDTNRAIVGPR